MTRFDDRDRAISAYAEIESDDEKLVTMDVDLSPELKSVPLQPWIRIRAIKAEGELVLLLAAAVRTRPPADEDDGA